MANSSPVPDQNLEYPYEEGYPLPEAPPDLTLPPGMGRDAVPHYLSFSQITNWANRTYRWGHDEALRVSRTNALAIRRDPVIMDALRTRQIPIAQLPWHLECENDQDQRQAEGVAFLTDLIDQIPRFQQLKMHLLEALWFGRYGVQLEYEWQWKQGQKCLKVRGFKPINGDKLVFKFSGQAGVLVHATFPGDWQITEMGRCHFFTPREREQVILHRHEPEDADFFEPELAGSLQGVGIRGRIYWLWYLRSQVTAFLMDYLERVGAGGLTIYYYEAGNIQSLQEVRTAAETQWRNNALLFPRYRDGTSGGPGVETVQASPAGAQLIQELITGYYDDTIRRYILGQSQASDAAGAGLGSGISDFLEGNLGRYIKYDAVNLGETLTEDLVRTLQKYSPYSDLPQFRFKFDVDKPNAGEVLGAAKDFYEMGGTIDEDHLREIVGLEKPQEGHSILSKMGNLSPQTVGMAPEGVPMLGEPGPEAPGGPISAQAGQGAPGGQIMQPGANGAIPGAYPPPIQASKKGVRLRFSREDLNAALKEHFPHYKSGLDYDPPDEAAVRDAVVEEPHHRIYLDYDAPENLLSLDFRHREIPEPGKDVWAPRSKLAPGSLGFTRSLRNFLQSVRGKGIKLEYYADKKHRRVYGMILRRMGWKQVPHPLKREGYEMWLPGLPSSPGQAKLMRKGDRVKMARQKAERVGWESYEVPRRLVSPSVDWSKRDLQDSSSPVTEETIRRDYAQGASHPEVYQSYIPLEDLPLESIPEDNYSSDPESEDFGSPDSWRVDFSARATYPPIKIMRDAEGKLHILDGNHRLRYWGEYAHVAPAWVIDYLRGRKPKKAGPVKMARRKKPRAWNPYPYLRTIQHHFSEHPHPHSKLVAHLAGEALKGDKTAFHPLRDALLESHEPGWVDTVDQHGLAWPPWEGTGQRGMHKKPTLVGHVKTDKGILGEGEGLYEAYPVYFGGKLHWTAGGRTEVAKGPMVANNQQLTPQELALLSRPSNADILSYEKSLGLRNSPLHAREERNEQNRQTHRLHQLAGEFNRTHPNASQEEWHQHMREHGFEPHTGPDHEQP